MKNSGQVGLSDANSDAGGATTGATYSKQAQSQMQPMYTRMVPSTMIDHNGVGNGPLPMQRTVSVQPQFESQDAQNHFE